MNQVNKVYIPYTSDESTNCARWQFSDEIVPNGGIVDLSDFAIAGRTIVDWDFDFYGSAPDSVSTVTIMYDDVIEPGMEYSSPFSLAGVKIHFENDNHDLAASSGTIENIPERRSLFLSGNADMDSGPASGSLKFDTLSLGNVSLINITIADKANKDVVGLLSRVKTIRVVKADDESRYAAFDVTGVSDPQYLPPPNDQETGYRQLAVTAYDYGMALSADDDVIVEFYRY